MKRRIPRACDEPVQELATHQPREMTVHVLAKYLEVDERTITRMISKGTLYAYKVGREWRIPTSDVSRAFPSQRAC